MSHFKLPKRIIPFPNRDKAFHETWSPERDLMDFPHPFRAVLAARPNSGKTCVIFNLILRVAQSPRPFQKIIVVHCDPQTTQEYSCIRANLLAEIPSPAEFSGEKKTLVILEDLDFLSMKKQQKGYLDRLFGYVSTHKNTSVIVTSQNPFTIPPSVRRCANLFVLWSSHDLDALAALARKSGLTAEQLHDIFARQCTAYHDSLWIDLTCGTQHKLRKNCYEAITLSGSEKQPKLHKLAAENTNGNSLPKKIKLGPPRTKSERVSSCGT